METETKKDPAERRGWKTSEFWAMFFTYVLTILLMSDVFPDTHWVVKASSLALNALATFGYTVSRGEVKKKAPETGFNVADLLKLMEKK